MSQLQHTKDGGKDRKTKSKPKGKKEHPVSEKMNSTQRRKGDAPKSDGLGGHHGGSKTGRLFDVSAHLEKFRAVHSRKLELDKRITAAKLPVWDHTCRVPRGTIMVDGVTTPILSGGKVKKRFQTYSEWKRIPQPESQLTKAIKCDHKWSLARTNFGKNEEPHYVRDYCEKCKINWADVKDEKDGYIILSETQSDDLKSVYDTLCQEIDEMRSMLRDGLGNRPFLFRLVYDQGYLTSAANTALQAVQRCRPSDDNVDFGFAQAIFDEYKMTHGEYMWFMNRSGSGNGSAVPAAAVAYDPVDATAVTKVPNILRTAQHQGPVQMNEAGTTPQQMNPTGFYHFKFKCPSGPQYAYGAVTSEGTGAWTDTQVTAVDYGYVKTCAAPLGAGITTQVAAYLNMWTEFRCTV